MKPPDEVTVTVVSSPSVVRRAGKGCSAARSTSMRLRLWALRRPVNFVEEPAVGGKVVEAAGAAQQQGVLDRALQMAVRPFDGAVLMRDTAVVAARRHAIMGAKRFVTGRPVGGGIALEVAKGGGQAVAAMFAW